MNIAWLLSNPAGIVILITIPTFLYIALLVVTTIVLWIITLLKSGDFNPSQFLSDKFSEFFEKLPLVFLLTLIFYTLVYGGFLFYESFINRIEIPFVWAFGILFLLVLYYALTLFIDSNLVTLFFVVVILIVNWRAIWEFLTIAWNFLIWSIVSVWDLLISLVLTQNWSGLTVFTFAVLLLMIAIRSFFKG